MKRAKIYIGLLFFVAVYATGCYKDVIFPEGTSDPNAPPQPVSYKAELAPLFNSDCALSGCHVTGAHKPYMHTDISYNELVNGGYVNTIIPEESILYIKINGDMKEYIPSASDRQKVYDWIRNGAPNN